LILREFFPLAARLFLWTPYALPTSPAWISNGARHYGKLTRAFAFPAARPGMPLWRETLFAAMVRLSGSAMEYYRLPPGRVVELGSQVEI
jgi:hypothetical protein